jgi:hypothetical protein
MVRSVVAGPATPLRSPRPSRRAFPTSKGPITPPHTAEKAPPCTSAPRGRRQNRILTKPIVQKTALKLRVYRGEQRAEDVGVGEETSTDDDEDILIEGWLAPWYKEQGLPAAATLKKWCQRVKEAEPEVTVDDSEGESEPEMGYEDRRVQPSQARAATTDARRKRGKGKAKPNVQLTTYAAGKSSRQHTTKAVDYVRKANELSAVANDGSFSVLFTFVPSTAQTRNGRPREGGKVTLGGAEMLSGSPPRGQLVIATGSPASHASRLATITNLLPAAEMLYRTDAPDKPNTLKASLRGASTRAGARLTGDDVYEKLTTVSAASASER